MQSSVELTQDLVRFNTINPPGAERACAERLAFLLEAVGFAVDLVPFGEGRAQLVARIGGTHGKLPLGFTGHLDTVPLGAQPWSVEPFGAEIADGKLYGRGSSDMKSGVAAFVSACIALADRLTGTPGTVLVITAGEETGCSGADALTRGKTRLPHVGALVVAEPIHRLLHRSCGQPAHHGAAGLFARDQAGIRQHVEMLHDRRQRHRKRLRQLADRKALFVAEPRQQCAPCGIGERGKGEVQHFFLILNHMV